MSDILTHDSGLAGHDASATADNFFTGSIITGAGSHDPYVSGYAFILWLKVPAWLSNGEEFKAFSQKNFKAFGGINDIDMEVAGITGGFTSNQHMYATKLGDKPSEFTLRYQAHSGSPLQRYYDEWVSGVRDPKTGIANYPAEFGLEYHSDNHTGTLLYVVTRPDANNFGGNNIEHASLWTHVMPKRISMGHFNFEQGNVEVNDLEQPFAGDMHFGQSVSQFAQKYVNGKIYPFVSENEFSNINVYTG